MPDRGAIWRIQGTLGHTETYQLLGLFLLAQRCLEVFKFPFDARQRGNRKLISRNNLGTITCSRGAYRAYGSDQGLVMTGVISKREVDTVEVSGSNPLVPTIFRELLPNFPAHPPSSAQSFLRRLYSVHPEPTCTLTVLRQVVSLKQCLTSTPAFHCVPVV